MRFLVRSCVMGRGAESFSSSMAMALASKMPTQMGMTESEAGSFRTTIGMLVAGSIISPRIRTSMSMESPFPLEYAGLDGFAYKTVWMRSGDSHLYVASRRGCYRARPGEIDRLVLAAAAGDLTTCRILAFNHDFHYLSQVPGIVSPLNLALAVKQHLKPVSLFGFRDGIDHDQGRRVGPGRVFKSEDAIVLDFGEKVHSFDE